MSPALQSSPVLNGPDAPCFHLLDVTGPGPALKSPPAALMPWVKANYTITHMTNSSVAILIIQLVLYARISFYLGCILETLRKSAHPGLSVPQLFTPPGYLARCCAKAWKGSTFTLLPASGDATLTGPEVDCTDSSSYIPLVISESHPELPLYPAAVPYSAGPVVFGSTWQCGWCRRWDLATSTVTVNGPAMISGTLSD